MSGKGSAPRPFDVPRETYESNFDRIFRKQGYGYCPLCSAESVQRERRPNGDDKCANGHTYPSSAALPEPQRATGMVPELGAGFEATPEEDEAFKELEQAQEREPTYAVKDIGTLFLTAVHDEIQIPQELFDSICEMEQENRLLRARNERLEHRLRELTGEEMP